jgi:hypothetical protein
MDRRKLLHIAAIIVSLAMVSSFAGGQGPGRSPGRHGGPQSAWEGGTEPETGPKWKLLFPADILDERSAAAGVYDASTNSLLVFSGSNFNSLPNDVLSLSNANGLGTSDWTTVIPSGAPGSPAGRTFHTAVYDSGNSRFVVFGGCAFTGGRCTTLLNDVWVLTNANGVGGPPAWVPLSPAGSPPAARWGHAAAYDAVNNRMIVYGGDNGSQVFSDTWVLSNANGLGGTPTWTQLSPTGGPPEGQDSPSIVYDAANNLLIEFAGTTQGFATDANSVWTLSNANGLGGAPVWKNIIPNGAAGSPAKRDGHIAVYDTANNRMIIFGGNANTPTGFPQHPDVWVLANANGVSGNPKWTRLVAPAPTPGGRTSPVGAYDSANNRLIIYGGSSWDGDFFSTWVLSRANGL